MKFFKYMAAFALLISPAFAQQGNMIVLSYSGAPTGTCAFYKYFAIDLTTGDFYDCFSGAWTKVNGGAAGAVSSVFGRTGAVVAQNGDYTPTQVGLGNLTNDVQTKAAIVPNTAPSAAQILVGNAGGTAYAPVGISGDSSMTSAGVMTNTKINNTAFSALATGILKNTTGTGVPSIAVGSDLPTAIPIASVGSSGLSGISPVTISAAGAIACATCLINNGVNTGTSAMTLDDSASTVANGFRVPVIAGGTAGLDGVEVYDSTNKNHHVRTNGADSIVAAYAAAPTTNFIPKAVVAAGNTILQSSALSDNGTTVTSSEGLAFSGASGAATTVSTASNASIHIAPNGTGGLIFDNDGTAANPAWAFNSQTGFGVARQAAGSFGLSNGSNFYMLLKSGTGVVMPQNASVSWVNSSTDATNATTKACLDNPTLGANSIRVSSNCGNAASPVAMTVVGMGSRSGTDTNVGGADITYQSGPGTGTGLPSRIRLQAPGDATASGSGAQSQLDRLVINGTKTLSNTTATATTVFTLAAGVTNRAEGGVVHYAITVSDGTDWCSLAGEVTFVLVAKAGTRSSATSTPIGETKIASGTACTTLSTTWAFAAASDSLQVTPAFTGITPTTVKIRYSVFNNGEDSISTF